jgi:hypothetical protein
LFPPASADSLGHTLRLDERADGKMAARAMVAALVAPAVSSSADLTAGDGPALATSQSGPPTSSSSTDPDCESAP